MLANPSKANSDLVDSNQVDSAGSRSEGGFWKNFETDRLLKEWEKEVLGNVGKGAVVREQISDEDLGVEGSKENPIWIHDHDKGARARANSSWWRS